MAKIQTELNAVEKEKETAQQQKQQDNSIRNLILTSDKADEIIINNYKDTYFITALQNIPVEISGDTGTYGAVAVIRVTKEQANKLCYDLQEAMIAEENRQAAKSDPMALLNMMSMFEPLLKNPKAH